MGEVLRGNVCAVLMSPNHEYPTYPQPSVRIEADGIPGDAHSGPLRKSFTKPGTLKPNDRPISIVADEVRQAMNERFGIDMQPGDFNEQLLVSGMGDLSDVKAGARVVFDSGVELEVVESAFPCTKLEVHNGAPGMIRELIIPQEKGRALSRRGILTRVLQAGDLAPGVNVTIVQPE